MTVSSDMNSLMAEDIIAFYDFIDGARNAMASESPESSLCAAVKDRIEIPQSESKDLKFESAIHADIQNIEQLLPYLQGFKPEELVDFQRMIYVEICGLEGDKNPREQLLRSRPGAIFIALSAALFWWGFWSKIYDMKAFQEPLSLLSFLIEYIIKIEIIEAVLILVILFGGMISINWYVYKTWRNMKQASFLRTINRAISLYLLNIRSGVHLTMP